MPPAILIRDLASLPDRFCGGAISIGNFDGVHLGHARIAGRLVDMARELVVPAVVFTFDPHQAALLRPDRAPTPLCWTERKAELLGRLGVDAVLAYPTDAAFLEMHAQEFFDRIIRQRLQARGMVEGRNFFFGHARSGTIDVLRGLCQASGVRLEVAEPVENGGQVVSSSRVRALVGEGRLREVCQMLTEPYRIHGVVVRGRGRGRTLGYPTANVAQVDTLLPREGIYAGRAWIAGVPHASAISIGPNPTFGEGALKIEAFVIDYQGDLYDQPIEVDFLAELRTVKKFASADELIAQMARDVVAARRIVGEESGISNLKSQI